MPYSFKDDKNRLIYGFSAPLLILVGAASLIVMTDSGAAAEGFAESSRQNVDFAQHACEFRCAAAGVAKDSDAV